MTHLGYVRGVIQIRTAARQHAIMDELDLPDDLKEDVEIIYLDDDEEIDEGMDDFQDDGIGPEDNDIEAQVVDLSTFTFRKHQGSVFACDLSKDGKLALTGGEDDMAYLWDIATGEVVLECTGHKDSVTEVGFNHDDQYIITGDMGGLMQVWSVKEKKLIWCYEGDDLTWLTWHHLTNVIISGTQAGDVYVFQIPQGHCKVLPSHGTPVNCGKLLPDGKHVLAGYTDGVIKLWDIKAMSSVWQYSDPQMTAVNSIETNNDGTLLCSAPSGQIVKIADGKLISSILPEGEAEIEMCTFDSDLGLLATGALSGRICIWEVGKQVLRHQNKIDASVTIVKFGKDGRLLIGAIDGAIYVIDSRSGQLKEPLTGHEYGVLSVAVSKDGSFLVSTSDDGTAKVFTLKSD